MFTFPILPNFSRNGKKSIEILLNHYWKDKYVFLNDEETIMTSVISLEVHRERITFPTLLAKKLEDSIALQLLAHHK